MKMPIRPPVSRSSEVSERRGRSLALCEMLLRSIDMIRIASSRFGQRVDRVDDAHDHHIDPAAAIAGRQADRHADQQ